MSVYKDGSKWRVIYRYTDSRGEKKQTSKRGFTTKREAQEWEREQMRKVESTLDMTFESFSEIYFDDTVPLFSVSDERTVTGWNREQKY